MKKIPRKFVFLIILLAIVILTIPIYYLTMYFNLKIDVKEKFSATENVHELDYTSVTNYDVDITCLSFDIKDNYSAKYEISIKNEQINGQVVDNKMSVKIALTANWISQDAFKSSSSNTINIKNEDNEKTFTINNLEIFNEHTNPLLPFPKPTLYILVSYQVKDNGKTTSYNDIIKYPYGSYTIETGGY